MTEGMTDRRLPLVEGRAAPVPSGRTARTRRCTDFLNIQERTVHKCCPFFYIKRKSRLHSRDMAAPGLFSNSAFFPSENGMCAVSFFRLSCKISQKPFYFSEKCDIIITIMFYHCAAIQQLCKEGEETVFSFPYDLWITAVISEMIY